MSESVSYVLVTPYTIAKSRTGGIIGRLLVQARLDLIGAQIFSPDEAFARDYAAYFRKQAAGEPSFLADYVEENFTPAQLSRPPRALLLLFRGEDACKKLAAVCGHLHSEHRNLNDIHGETIRDTYADLILEPDNPQKYVYFEPAVITPRNDAEAREALSIFAKYLHGRSNIIPNCTASHERTLVILKPDNWRTASARPGTILDMFSRAGLTIVGIKVFCFSLNQALKFYGDVKNALLQKLGPVFGKKGRALLEEAFNITMTDEDEAHVAASFGRAYATDQFEQIVEFMSGKRPSTCPPADADKAGDVKCMIVIYEGDGAVEKIRAILGPTDPTKAPPGTVRREFGSNVMVNTAHASDSPESYARESEIVKVNDNTLAGLIERTIS